MPFKKGIDPNRNYKGRGKGLLTKMFEDALEKVEQEEGTNFFLHVVRRAYKNDDVAKSLINKMLPDLSKVDSESAVRLMDGIKLILTDNTKVILGGDQTQ